MRALMTATVPSMIGQFNMNNIKLLQELGYEVDVACSIHDHTVWSEEKISEFKKQLENIGVNIYDIEFSRGPFQFSNHLRSYKSILRLMNVQEYDLIHTHTPISSLITRVAYRRSKIYSSCKMIYTAHGFHFFKGNNPIKNLLFRNIEKIGARYTDVLITINKEDYVAAKQFHLKNGGSIEYVPGVGIDLEKIDSISGMRTQLLQDLHLPDDSILMLSVGELNDNKNHRLVIETLSHLPGKYHYLICGVGPLMEQHKTLAETLGVQDRLHMLGYRNDVLSIMKSCDLFVFPSKREGLSVALMEALACGMPCIASNIRGNTDLIGDMSGILFNSADELEKGILQISQLPHRGKDNIKKYDLHSISNQMRSIYEC